MARPRLVHFDWAIKRLIRNKSNYVILEGFISVLMGEDIHIEELLESESNQDNFEDKFNRVDLLAKNSKGELILVEVQNSHELDYFHRMLYGTSKAIVEYMHRGDKYEKVKKVYSINIVYFELGQGSDYIYHGKTVFRGLHKDDILQLSQIQQDRFISKDAGDIFPEYYVLRVNDFDALAVTPLDEWISFLKTSEIPEKATAQGLPEAREVLRIDSLSNADQNDYERHIESLRYQKSVIETGYIDGLYAGRAEGRAEGRVEGRVEGRAEGRAEGETIKQKEIARKMKIKGISVDKIEDFTGLSKGEIESL